jgi:uncharacterized surface protein with fasciclin (FAS1) repeats
MNGDDGRRWDLYVRIGGKAMNITRFMLLGLALMGAMLIGCNDDDDDLMADRDEPLLMGGRESLIQNLAADNSYTTFVKLARQSGLDTTLAEAGNYTVFAPTNAAFDRLPVETLASLQQPENSEQLREILRYHISSREYRAGQLRTVTLVPTIHGDRSLDIRGEGDFLYVNGARIVRPNAVIADNGVAHGIDTVLMP